MIVGTFDEDGRPFVDLPHHDSKAPGEWEGAVPPWIQGPIARACIPGTPAPLASHSPSSRAPFPSQGWGGSSAYYREPAVLFFADGPLGRLYVVDMLIAQPVKGSEALPSLLGRNIINRWSVAYDPSRSRLECTVRQADYTMDAA